MHSSAEPGAGKKPRSRNAARAQDKTRAELIRDLNKLDRKIVELEARLAKAVSARKNRPQGVFTREWDVAPAGAESPSALEEKYRHLVERSLQGVLIAEGVPPRIVFANEALARILGYSVDDIISMSPTRLKNILHPDDRDIFFRRYRDRLEGKKGPRSL